MHMNFRHNGSAALASLMLAGLLSVASGGSARLPVLAAARGGLHAPGQRPAAAWRFTPPARPGPRAAQSIGSEWQTFVPGVLGYVLVTLNSGVMVCTVATARGKSARWSTFSQSGPGACTISVFGGPSSVGSLFALEVQAVVNRTFRTVPTAHQSPKPQSGARGHFTSSR